MESIFDPKKARRVREGLGFSQTAVAAALDRSVSTISNWEAGIGEPDVSDYFRLKRLYRCKDGDLLTGDAELHMAPTEAAKSR